MGIRLAAGAAWVVALVCGVSFPVDARADGLPPSGSAIPAPSASAAKPATSPRIQPYPDSIGGGQTTYYAPTATAYAYPVYPYSYSTYSYPTYPYTSAYSYYSPTMTSYDTWYGGDMGNVSYGSYPYGGYTYGSYTGYGLGHGGYGYGYARPYRKIEYTQKWTRHGFRSEYRVR